MENKEKKEYGGCLSTLLPLWIIGQILTIIYNLAFAGFYTDYPSIPIILIGTNIIALVGIILLLQFKKIGFYLFILTFVITFLVGVFFPDYVKDNTIFRSIFGLGLFLLLMSFKSKETKLNGYQTLGLFNSQINTEKSALHKQATSDNEETNTNNDIIDTYITNEEAVANEDNKEVIPSEDHDKGTKQNSIMDDICSNSILETSHKTKRFVYIIISLLFIASVIIALFLITKDNRSNNEIFNDAKSLIDKKEYKEGVEELNKIKDDYIPAKALLGRLYYFNDTVGINKEFGESLLWEAFEANDSNACHTLWDIYINTGEWDILFKIATKVTEFGENTGPRMITWLYFTDELGGKKNNKIDYKKAEFYALKVAKDDIYTSFYLGQMYSDGGHGIEKDDAKAFYWWNNGARLGDTDCYDNLGWSYFHGNGVNQNFKKAYESFKKAIKIDSTDAYAHYYMALMFKDGLYVKANRDSLKFYLQKAKDFGSEDALIMYENEF